MLRPLPYVSILSESGTISKEKKKLEYIHEAAVMDFGPLGSRIITKPQSK